MKKNAIGMIIFVEMVNKLALADIVQCNVALGQEIILPVVCAFSFLFVFLPCLL